MRREEVLRILKVHEAELRERGVLRLQLFGSVARGEETERSDIDLLADFRPRLGVIKIGGIQYKLEQILNAKVDLSSPDWLKPKVSQEALREAIDVF